MASTGGNMVPGVEKDREHWRFISVQTRGCLSVIRRSDKQREQHLQLARYLVARECEIVGMGGTQLGTEERCARSSFRAPHGKVAAVQTQRSARAAVLKKNEETTSSLAPSSTAAVVLHSFLCSRCACGSSRRSSTSGTRHRRRWSMQLALARCRPRLRPRCPRARARPSGTRTPTPRLR